MWVVCYLVLAVSVLVAWKWLYREA